MDEELIINCYDDSGYYIRLYVNDKNRYTLDIDDYILNHYTNKTDAMTEATRYIKNYVDCNYLNAVNCFDNCETIKDIHNFIFNDCILSCNKNYLQFVKTAIKQNNNTLKLCTFKTVDDHFFILDDDIIKLLKDAKIKPIIL